MKPLLSAKNSRDAGLSPGVCKLSFPDGPVVTTYWTEQETYQWCRYD
jgi:hypothetical protein